MVKTMPGEINKKFDNLFEQQTKAPRYIKTEYNWGKLVVWILMIGFSISIWILAIKSMVAWMS